MRPGCAGAGGVARQVCLTAAARKEAALSAPRTRAWRPTTWTWPLTSTNMAADNSRLAANLRRSRRRRATCEKLAAAEADHAGDAHARRAAQQVGSLSLQARAVVGSTGVIAAFCPGLYGVCSPQLRQR